MQRIHKEFDQPTPDSDSVRNELLEIFPDAMRMAGELMDVFGDGCKVLRYEQNGNVVKKAGFKADSDYHAAITADEFINMGKHSAENAKKIQEKESGNVRR